MQSVNPQHQHVRSTHNFDFTDAIIHHKEDVGLLLLRLSIGGLMLIHGFNKLIYGTQGVEQALTGVGAPPFLSLGVFLGEIVGPLMVILGLKSRVGAIFIAMDMLVAVLLVHSSQITQMSETGGWMLELNALYLLGSIVIIFLGSGRYSVTKGVGVFD